MSGVKETDLRVMLSGESIDATIIEPLQPKGSATFLHGAGESTKERCLPLARQLAHHGWRCLTFSYPGHGNSSGSLLGSTLEQRRNLTEALMKELGFLSSELLIGVSMGAHTAIGLLERIQPEHLVLFVPAAYAVEAEATAFGPDFTTVLRREKSYHTSRSWDILPSYKGKMVTIEAGNDAVIPSDVHTLIHSHATKASHKHHVVIKDSQHQISFWLAEDEQRIVDFAHAIDQFHFDDIIAKY